MGKSISIIFLKQKPTDNEGNLYIRTIEDRVPKRKSLRIKIKASDWTKYFNEKTQRFRVDKRYPDGESINDIISHKLKELSKNDNELSYLPDEKKSFTKFWEKYIGTIENYGTKIKHEVVLAKLKKYLTFNNKNGLLFIEITPSLLRELKLYFSKTKDPKILSENTVNHYLKIMKSIIRKAAAEEYFVFSKDPFVTIKFNRNKTIKNVLNADELFSIIKTMFWENDELEKVRNMFLFQIFSNGMRVSDLFLLRWNCFEGNRLTYNMFKTSYNISMPLNSNLAGILHEQLGTTETYEKLLKTFAQPVVYPNGEFEKLKMDEIEARINKYANNELEITAKGRERLLAAVDKHTHIRYKSYFIEKEHEENIICLIEAKEKLLKLVDDLYITSIFSKIRHHKNGSLNDFVFPVLDNEVFKNIDGKNDFSKITLEQYKMLKHATIVYNRKLKELQRACQVTTTLTSHVARHSFTNLLLTMNDVNLYDISQSLGHSSISVTQNYINSGFNSAKVDYINNQFAKTYRKKS